ncbi:alpha-1,6-mannosyl-glycoprotein 4-beta-N-acetylglucosaminyltransferase-like [Saccostrea cucullata]|uniref:alpha-1,6-mannosyl-glycoprotein 4-beta-N-acetylglucosaminyltransferase-like n=1 Tax=Saccostrea cuccullata TaxID=36930 RepID=UPI002ED357E8
MEGSCQNKRPGFLTIGIPTVCRKKQQYILSTLDSVVSGLSRGQRQEVVIVIYLADQDKTCRQNTKMEIRLKYPNLVRTCLIRFLHPPKVSAFYPPLIDKLKAERDKKLIWRSKQNLDFSFLLIQCQNLSSYYLQLEDDLMAVSRFYSTIKNTVVQRVTHWVCMEFNELGFIGKLFRSRDLMALATMIIEWYEHTPADDTYIEFYKRRNQKSRILIQPTLFQHVGLHSSLEGRLQKLKDPYFEGDIESKETVIRNPPANISTSMKIDFQHLPRHCYEGSKGFFLTSEPVISGDTFYVLFHSLQNVSRIFVQTGLALGKGHVLQEGVLELGGDFECTKRMFTNIYKFSRGVIDATVNRNNLRCIQIRVIASQNTLLMIKEISIYSV